MALTHKQRRFVQEYLRSETGTEAALRAGYAALSAPVTASRLMNDPEILAAIEEGQQKRLDRVEVDANYLLKRLHEEVEADLADLYDEETGDLLPVHQWPEVWRRGLVAGVEIEAVFEGRGEDRVQIGTTKKLKLSDRARRIEALGRHVSVAAFRDTLQIKSLDGLADRLARVSRAQTAPDVVNAEPAPALRSDAHHSTK
ncbi:terminase small subunit [Mesorhizobium japonicum]|uniref:Mlr5477 protein n=1 Tax=Mesorhizobium japonicum (strain LMG 29417 / CECT 9101 / MAFF 303099) TaxID=266835 RepID=Q98BP9_RHILO|nr:terminase small subunit [Mesorhizobium japonicum]BAB51923.1 mlr5477 [Mesorhizobium japonicum MAFF 303099]